MKIKNQKDMIPIKNYVIVAVIILITIVITIGVKLWHESYRKYQLTIPIISGQVQEVNYKEFSNYIMEHDEFLLYIGVASDLNCREFEKKAISVLKNKNVINELIYLNITDIDDKDTYLKDLSNKYGNKDINLNYPSFIIIKNNKFLDLVKANNSGKLEVSEIERILDLYEIGE